MNMTLTASNYHGAESNLRYFSNSQVTRMRECAAKHVAQLSGKWPADEPSEALLIGSYVDRALLTPDELLGWKAANCKNLYSARNGKPFAFVELAETMVARAKQDEAFMRVLQGEHQVYVTWTMFGHEWKAAIDVANPDKGYFADLKTCPSLDHDTWSDELRKKLPWYDKYFQQIAIYREAFKAHYGKPATCAMLAAVTKQDPPDIGLVSFDDSHAMRYEYELNEIAHNIDAWAKMKRGEMEPTRCESCDYCRSTNKLDGSKITRAIDSRYERTI